MNDPKFAYGYDVNVYIEKAIERIDGEYHYVRYVTFSPGDTEREIMDVDPWSPRKKVENAEDFIDRIVYGNDFGMLLAKDKGLKKFLGFE